MKRFEISFYIGDAPHRAQIVPEQEGGQLVFKCILSAEIFFKIRKNDNNKWENLDGNSSALSKLIGWEIDNYLKKENLKKKNFINRWDLNLR